VKKNYKQNFLVLVSIITLMFLFIPDSDLFAGDSTNMHLSSNINSPGSDIISKRKRCKTGGGRVACSRKCPNGYKRISGGCLLSNQWFNLSRSYPINNGWYCRGREDYGSENYGSRLYVYVLCQPE